jgi:hypothetical protein
MRPKVRSEHNSCRVLQSWTVVLRLLMSIIRCRSGAAMRAALFLFAALPAAFAARGLSRVRNCGSTRLRHALALERLYLLLFLIDFPAISRRLSGNVAETMAAPAAVGSGGPERAGHATITAHSLARLRLAWLGRKCATHLLRLNIQYCCVSVIAPSMLASEPGLLHASIEFGATTSIRSPAVPGKWTTDARARRLDGSPDR